MRLRFGSLAGAGRLINISEGGCNVRPQFAQDVLEKHERQIIRLRFGDTEVMGRILRYIPGKKSYAVQFLDMESETYARLVQYIFNNRDAGFGAFASKSLVHTLFTRVLGSFRARAAQKRHRRAMEEKQKEACGAKAPEKAEAYTQNG